MALHSIVQDSILRVTLDSPERGNSFGLDDAKALQAALKTRAPVDGLIFTATGRLFCAGGNLDDYAKMKKPEQGKRVNRQISTALAALSKWPMPTVCVVTGDCYGGGVEVISAFDKVFAVPAAMFGLWQRRIGLSFGWGGGSRLEARLGSGRLRRLALEARSFSAYEAQATGLVDTVCLRSSILAEAEAWLRSVSRWPRNPIGPLKSYVSAQETKIFERLWWNDEHRAVLEQRRSRKQTTDSHPDSLRGIGSSKGV